MKNDATFVRKNVEKGHLAPSNLSEAIQKNNTGKQRKQTKKNAIWARGESVHRGRDFQVEIRFLGSIHVRVNGVSEWAIFT